MSRMADAMAVHGLAGAAGLLDRQRAERVGFLHSVFLLHAADLEDLAAEADHDDAGEIRMARIAPLRAPQHLEAFAVGGIPHPVPWTIGTMPSMLGMIGQDAGAVDRRRGEARDGSRTVHRGEDPEVVARAGSSRRPAIALECRAQLRREQIVVARILAEAVIAVELVHADIVLVHPLARSDGTLGEADDLPELADGRALRDRRDRHLVPPQDSLPRRDAGGDGTGGHEIDRNDDVVVRVQADGAGRRDGCVHS